MGASASGKKKNNNEQTRAVICFTNQGIFQYIIITMLRFSVPQHSKNKHIFLVVIVDCNSQNN